MHVDAKALKQAKEDLLESQQRVAVDFESATDTIISRPVRRA